jgi:hypothetical protein
VTKPDIGAIRRRALSMMTYLKDVLFSNKKTQPPTAIAEKPQTNYQNEQAKPVPEAPLKPEAPLSSTGTVSGSGELSSFLRFTRKACTLPYRMLTVMLFVCVWNRWSVLVQRVRRSPQTWTRTAGQCWPMAAPTQQSSPR